MESFALGCGIEMIVNPRGGQRTMWYRCGYIEGKYITEHFGILPIHIDNKFYYYVETKDFKEIKDKIPDYIKIFSYLKNMKQKIDISFRNWRRKK